MLQHKSTGKKGLEHLEHSNTYLSLIYNERPIATPTIMYYIGCNYCPYTTPTSCCPNPLAPRQTKHLQPQPVVSFIYPQSHLSPRPAALRCWLHPRVNRLQLCPAAASTEHHPAPLMAHGLWLSGAPPCPIPWRTTSPPLRGQIEQRAREIE